jgi:hypothetical protein
VSDEMRRRRRRRERRRFYQHAKHQNEDADSLL